MEWKIGEIKQVNGEWYQCVEQPYYISDVCKICSFSGIGNCELDRCSGTYRSDKTSVIFKKLEKVGEPFSCNYYGDARLVMMHEYQLFDVNVIYTDKMPPMYITDYKHNRIAIEIKVNKEDMEEKDIKPYDKIFSEGTVSNTENLVTSSLKPFDLEAAKAGKPVCTRDGHKARIICFDRISGDDYYKIVACVTAFDGDFEEVLFYGIDGYIVDSQNPKDEDLMMLPEKKEGWVNVYKHNLYDTESEAKRAHVKEGYIDTIKIEWEE